MTERYRYRDLQQAWGVARTFEVSLNDLSRNWKLTLKAIPFPQVSEDRS